MRKAFAAFELKPLKKKCNGAVHVSCDLHAKLMSGVDSLRETRTMVLLSLPFPPLPVYVRAVDPLELSAQGEMTETTTHTLLARCMDAEAERGDQERNARRRQRQTKAFQQFVQDLALRGFDMEAPELFEFYCEHSKNYLHTYFEEGELRMDVMFARLEDVTKGSKPHTKMCEYCAAQSILFKDEPPKTRAHYERKGYGSLLLMTRDRLGHKMTEEEHARAVEIMKAEEAAHKIEPVPT